MQKTATKAVIARKPLDVLIAVRSDALGDAVEEVVTVDEAEADTAAAVVVVAAKILPATAAGAANAPMAAAMAMVHGAFGPVRVRTSPITPATRSRNISRPRARRCFTASSLMSSASATARTD